MATQKSCSWMVTPGHTSLDDLNQIIERANWFTNLGRFGGGEGMLAVSGLDALSSARFGMAETPFNDMWDRLVWLPTSTSEDDLFHGDTLRTVAERLGKPDVFSTTTATVYKRTLASLRSVEKVPLLVVGPQDFTGAAKGAAAFAVRRATQEIIVGRQSAWCSLLPLYAAGQWPLGIMPDGRLVVL